jgi:hypothetical protein
VDKCDGSLLHFIRDGILVLPESLVDFPRSLHIRNCQQIVSLGNLRSVKGGLYLLGCTALNSLGDLEFLDGPLDCQDCPNLKDTGRLKRAAGYINVGETSVREIPDQVKILPLFSNYPAPRITSFALNHN